MPKDVLNKTGKGIPCFCDGLPIKFAKNKQKKIQLNCLKKLCQKFKTHKQDKVMYK